MLTTSRRRNFRPSLERLGLRLTLDGSGFDPMAPVILLPDPTPPPADVDPMAPVIILDLPMGDPTVVDNN